VVEGAQRIQVALAERDGYFSFDISPAGRRKILEAKLVGSDKETDLALLKVDAHNLKVLPLGQLGQCTRRSGSGGRQSGGIAEFDHYGGRQFNVASTRLDQRMAYIQTDAPINPE